MVAGILPLHRMGLNMNFGEWINTASGVVTIVASVGGALLLAGRSVSAWRNRRRKLRLARERAEATNRLIAEREERKRKDPFYLANENRKKSKSWIGDTSGWWDNWR